MPGMSGFEVARLLRSRRQSKTTPVLFLTGVARNLFVPLALTITFALTTSFFVSRTVTPLLCLQVLKAHPLGVPRRGIVGAITRFLDAVDERYARMIRWVLRHRLLIVTGILSLFGASLFLSTQIGSEFFPDADESQFSGAFTLDLSAQAGAGSCQPVAISCSSVRVGGVAVMRVSSEARCVLSGDDGLAVSRRVEVEARAP